MASAAALPTRTGHVTPAAAPFAAAWANVPRTPAARARRRILVVGQEQGVAGLNTSLACCNVPWAHALRTPVVRGAFLVNDRLQPVKDLVSYAKATPTTLSYTIRKNAFWNWGGRKIPVTYQDFVYTWQQVVAPASAVASRTGYDRITGYTHRGERQITFTWTKPVAAWQLLFDVVYPSQALAGLDFNRIWTSCICGNDGKPVSDGPFTLTSYTSGSGATLQPNPFWYGRKPQLRQIVFRVLGDTYSETKALRRGVVDAINPTFSLMLVPLRNARGITYSQVPGLYQEHLDLQLGQHGQPLLRAPWMRRAIMLAINRKALVDDVYGDLATRLTPLDSLLFFQQDARYRPDFKALRYDAKKALAILRRHCTGGPAHVGAAGTWTCSGFPASFRYSWDSSNATRSLQEATVKAQLQRVGIAIVDAPMPSSTVLGPAGIPSGDYDLASFAWLSTGDPAALAQAWRCGGESNYSGYCSADVTRLMDEAEATLDPRRRAALYVQADRLLARDVPSIPLYSQPEPLVYRAGVLGLRNNPSSSRFTWNAEQWRWGRRR